MNAHSRSRSGPPPRARLALLAALGLAVLLNAWMTVPADAQDDDVILEATYDWERAILADDLVFGANTGCQETPPDRFNATAFSFAERATEQGCGHANFSFFPPEGVSTFTIAFTANRSIQAAAGQIGFQPVAPQNIYLAEGRDLNITNEFAYFDSTSGTKPYQRFTIELKPREPWVNQTIYWYFEDRGQGTSLLPTSTIAFSAHVYDPVLAIEGIPLPPGRVLEQHVAETNTTRTITTNASIEIPELLESPLDSARVRIQLLTPDALVGITSPRGIPLNVASIGEEAAGLQRTRILDDDILRNIGPGTYTFTFQRTETLPPPAAPPAPATIYPLVYLLSLLPIPTAAYAYSQVWRVRRASEGGFGRAGGLYIGAAALTLGYLGLLAFLYFSGVLAGVATLPVAGIDPFVFAGFILLAIGFIALGALVARAVLRAMQRDLDERRRIQRELERSNQELEHFAYVASHDLQEPLRTISGFSQLLHKRYGDELDERAVRYITRTVEGTDRMSRLINDLLEYSRVDSRGRPMEPTDLNKLLDEVKQDLETMIQDSGAKVSADHLPTVMADRTQVAQVLSNLVRNAIKYRHEDRSPEVHVSSSQEDGSWVVSVRDNGMGIPEDQQERAFVIFQRLVPRETDDTGTGLGLAISRKIVERHGGRIWVESDGSTGSTFHFTLPRDPSTNGAITGPKAKAKRRGRRQRGNRAVT